MVDNLTTYEEAIAIVNQQLLRKYENFYDSMCALLKSNRKKVFFKILKSKTTVLDSRVTFANINALLALGELKHSSIF